MTQPTGAAPPRRPARENPEGIDARSGALRAAAALPLGLLARDPRGRLELVNEAARGALKLEDVMPSTLGLTLIQRGHRDDESLNVYLLTTEDEPLQRIVARPIEVALDTGAPLELLMLIEPGPGPRAAVPGMRRALANLRRRSRSHAAAARTVAFTPRDLLACAVRRLRRRGNGAAPVRVGSTPARRVDRVVRVDAIAFAEVVLSAAEMLGAGAAGESLRVSATVAGQRLRIELETPAPPGSRAPSLPDRDDWLRGVRAFLDSHRATFEVHDDAKRRSIQITLPLSRRGG